ncbi:MAG: efflux RND transporter periplasmic adaptor subunit [Rhodothermia bacterium]|nr:MAG: efflux RND transporter periplasmic adaptor subunit [Rhodothermia bacterium]
MPPQIMNKFAPVTLPILTVATGLLLSSCGSDGSAQAPTAQSTPKSVRAVEVETIVVEPTPFEDMVALIGVVESPRDAVLSAQSAGTLVFQSDLGADVRKGGVVARIDAVLIQAALDQSKANLASVAARAALAEDTFRRQEPLFQDSIISALEFEKIRSDLNAARAQKDQALALVAQAEKQLENTFVRAPFSGRVEIQFTEEGELVMPGTQVARIVDTRNLTLRAGVPERYAIDIQKGTSVSIHFKAYGVGKREGVISFVGSVIDPLSRSFAIEIELDNEDGAFKPEMVADVFVTRSRLENQLVLPLSSILRDEFGSSVYVVDRSSGSAVVVRKPVGLGASFGGSTVVTTGLNAGDEVIVVGQTNVTEGDTVYSVTSDA